MNLLNGEMFQTGVFYFEVNEVDEVKHEIYSLGLNHVLRSIRTLFWNQCCLINVPKSITFISMKVLYDHLCVDSTLTSFAESKTQSFAQK